MSRQTSCLQIDKTTIHKVANKGSKLSLLIGGAATISQLVHLNPTSAIIYISYTALSWLGCRTISYLCSMPTSQLLNSEIDTQHALKISDKNVKVDVFSKKPNAICESIGLTTSDVMITPLKHLMRMEFIASKGLMTKFIKCVQMLIKDENINYTLSPIYEDVEAQEKKEASSVSLSPSVNLKNLESVDFKISKFITLIVFAPKRCSDNVRMAISENRKEQIRLNSQPTFTENGVARWETLGVLKKPGSYENCEKDECEIKITTEIHRSNLLKTLYAIVNVHIYNEVGYDVCLSCTPYDPKVKNTETTGLKILRKISNYVKFVFFYDVNLELSTNVKLIVCAPIGLVDNVRKLIGENGGGVIGNYAHCSFTTGEMEAKSAEQQSNTDLRVRIETVVAKNLFRKITNSLKELKKEISYSLLPMFEKIDTKTLRQRQYFLGAIKTFFFS